VTDPIPSDGLNPPARTWAVVSIAIAIALTVLDSSIANVALPVIAHDFGSKPADAIWIVNGYQLAIVMALLPLAALSEIVGFRRVYVAGLALFAVASVACALSRSLPALTAARALQGLGAAGVMSVNGGLIRFIWPSRLLGRGIGLNAVIVSVAAAVGPSLASAILAVGPWPWLFAVNVPIALTALALAARVLPANPLSRRRFDWISAVLNAIAFGALISGVDLLTRTPNVGAGAALTLGALVAGGVLVRREWSRATPLVPFDLLRTRMFGLSVATSIAAFTAQTLAFISLPFHLEDTLHRGQVATGLLMTPWPAAVALAAPAAGWLSDRVSTALLCAAGLTVLAAGFSALALLGEAPATLDIGWRMALCGLGFGLFQTPNNRMMLTSAPRDRGGAAGGMLGTARLTGQITGAVLTAILLELLGARGEIAALVAAAAFALVAAAISLTRLGGPRSAEAVIAAPP
jgi:DHA2 family multidrug resistance protein-like MFS transporter